MEYKATIGLEVHAELATLSKMFCGCTNQPHGAQVNTYICPVCMAHPGTLPVPNQDAIGMVLQFGQAIGAKKATYSEFDRKNYFYPDIPKAYQISQYKFPFLTGGSIQGVQLTRVHLEEDTARSSHELTDGSIVDFNRAGVPLMELVTEPVMHDAKTAGNFARELQLILQTLGISEANMERGEMRIEANVSVSADPDKMSKTYAEIKNINSFKAVEAAIEYEIVRQRELIESGGEIAQETRGWDENRAVTFSQRSKETAKDYRYFPDPDLPKVMAPEVAAFSEEVLSEKISALPAEKRLKYSDIGISTDTIEVIIANKNLDQFFALVIALQPADDVSKLAANYVSVDMAGLQAEGLDLSAISPQVFVDMMLLIVSGDIGSRGAKDLLPLLPDFAGDIKDLAKEKGLLQMSDTGALEAVVQTIISNNPDQVAEYKAGKETVLKFLIGQGMKETKGAANPQVLEELLQTEILK